MLQLQENHYGDFLSGEMLNQAVQNGNNLLRVECKV